MRTWKRILSIAMIVVMTVSICGCGKKENDGSGGITNVKQASASPDLAKQYVYQMDSFDFSKLQVNDGDITVLSFKKVQDRMVAVLQKYAYSESGDSSVDYMLAVIDPKDLSVETISMEVPTQPEEEAESKNRPADGAADFYESTYYNNFQISDNGFIYGSRTYDYNNYADPENYVREHRESVCCWDSKGALQWDAPLEELASQDNWYYQNALIVQKDGSVQVLVGGDRYGLIKVDKDGTVSALQNAGKLQELLENYAGLGIMPDGKLLVSYYDANWQNMYVNTYDFGTDKPGEAVKLPASVSNSLSARFALNADGDLIYTTSSGVYQYHLGDEAEQQIMSFVNSDLYVTGFDSILPLDDTSFAAIYGEYDYTNYVRTLMGGVFHKVDAKDIPDKKVLVLGGAYLYGDIQKRVVDYNKTNSEYRIVMKDYSKYNTYDDYTACYTQLNNDIISGQMPDILVLDAYNLSLEKYANKGLLADIGELIKKDNELSKVKYMDNIFDACKYNGKLYEVIPAFTVQGYMGKKALVGDKTAWTMEEAMKLLDGMPEGTALFSDMTRDQFIQTMFTICGTQFIDIDTGKCDFDTDQFRTFMKYAKSLPEQFGEDHYGDTWYRFYESQYRENRTVLASCYITEISDLVYSVNGLFGEEVSLIGFPGTDKTETGAVINTGTSYALAGRSSNLDAAWQFVRYYLTDEYQDSITYQLPVKKAALEKNAQKAMKKPSYVMDGKEVEEEYHYWINDEMIDIQPLSQKQVDQVLTYISSLKRRAYYNTAVTGIVSEEMGAYFRNQKSAEDVSALIQNRVQLYINENR